MEQNEKTSAGEEKANSAQPPWQPILYVGIGASAGGLEAIETFFTNMPPQSGFAFIVVQHLSPDYKSLMVELLSKRTEMQVFRAEDGMVVERNKVYLIPPKKNLKIFHGKLLLDDQDYSKGLNLPIDIFLRSLAEDQGEKAVGIILSGTGSDGMRGTRAVKESGGIIMVQDEETAKFDGMPRAAISTGLADFILPPDEMPKQLLAFSKHPYTSKSERAETLLSDEDGLTRIFSLLRERSKVDFTYYKPSTVTRRIERRMSVNQFQDIRDYVQYLQDYPGEVLALYRELLIGVTNFFRDQEAFNILTEKYLPEMFLQKENREFRFWIAGCSTGEEAYTFAIIARECMEKLGKSLDVKIFATDVDKDAIVRAGTGVYPASIAADLSPRLLAKYFYHKEDNFQIARNIREMVVFAQHNLIKDPPFTNIDLVSCRNLLIYLQPVLQKKVMELINFSLNTNGILVLGTSETIGEMNHFFETLSQKYKIYQSKNRARPIINSNELLAITDRQPRIGNTHLARFDRTGHRTYDSDRLLERFIDAITGDFVPLTMIINDQLEIQHVFGDTEGFLKVPSGRVSNEISKMASKDLSIPLTTGIQKVFRTQEEMRFSNIRLRNIGQDRIIDMRIKPLPQKKGQEAFVAVFLSQNVVEKQDADEAVNAYDLSKEAEQRIKDLEQELQFTKENLQATIEELETANEELQATNEELLASNEELQSTNEELQSTNEELHTVNSEYQNKIIELTELNNDVENLLSSSQIGTLMLDENLEIRKFSPQVTNILKILENDAGRPITHINHYITNTNPYELIRYVQETSQQRDEQVLVEDGRWYLMRVMPYAIGPQKFSGIVVSFIDITQIKSTQEALEKSESVLKRTAQLAKVGSWEYNLETGEHDWSDETYAIHELEPGRQPSPEEGINFYTPESRPIITQAFQEACEKGLSYDLVLEINTAKGTHKWVRALGTPQFKNGKVEKVAGAFQDITELKEASEALERSEKRFQDLFNSMNEGFALHEIITDDNGRAVDYRFLAVNPAFERLTGLDQEKVIGQRILEVMPQTEEYWIRRYGQVALTGISDYFENYSGELDRWFSVSAYSSRKNQFFVIFSDITDRIKAEEELRETSRINAVMAELAENLLSESNIEQTSFLLLKAAQELTGSPHGFVGYIDRASGHLISPTLTREIWSECEIPGKSIVFETFTGLWGWVLKRGLPLLTNDPDKNEHSSGVPENHIPINRFLAAPVLIDNKVAGMIALANSEKDYTENELSILQKMASLYALGVQRMRTAQDLSVAKDRLDLAFSAAGMGWWDWDLASGQVDVSPVKPQLFGYQAEEIGPDLENWTDLIHPEDHDQAMSAMKRHLDGETERYQVKYRLKTKTGGYQWAQDRGMIVKRDEDGKPLRLVGTVQKIDDPKGC